MLQTRGFRFASWAVSLASQELRATTSALFASLATLVLVEHRSGRIDPATLSTIRAAKDIGSEVTALVAGHGAHLDSVAKLASETLDVSKVLVARHASLEHQLAEPLALLLTALQGHMSFSHILAPGTTFGKNVLPRAAAKLGVQPVSDVVRVVSKDTFIRPIYAGNALATVQCMSPQGLHMLTVRPSAFPCTTSAASAAGAAEIQDVPAHTLSVLEDGGTPLSQFENEDSAKSERPELGSAKVVVCGGRALKSSENFKMLGSLADVLGGAVGASRAAVDAGFVANDLQVGQTGKVVAPQLYIGIGISGAIQHLAGMKDSKTIVAINTDPEAPIFQVADYGLVQDLFTAVPELEKQIKKLQGGSA